MPSTGSSYSTGSTGSSSTGSGSAQAGDYGFSSSVSPMSVATTPGNNFNFTEKIDKMIIILIFFFAKL